MSVERELGRIGQSLVDLNRGQEHIIDRINTLASITKKELDTHREEDDEKFEKLSEKIGNIQIRLAAVCAGIAVIAYLVKLYT